MPLSALGVDVPAALLPSWRAWFAPGRQPFDVAGVPDLPALPPVAAADVGPEVRDTFELYGPGERRWLTEDVFDALPIRVRAALVARRAFTSPVALAPLQIAEQARVQTGRSRFVWWPGLLAEVGDAPVLEFVQHRLPPSDHRAVSDATWAAAAALLPGARELAGTFADRSGPNCFGTVMAAAGVRGAQAEWMTQEPFERWLAGTARPHRGRDRDDRPGVVLVWREGSGSATHAAVTIGDGWALSKPSQGWFTPRLVWTVAQTVRQSRQAGDRLHRYRLIGAP